MDKIIDQQIQKVENLHNLDDVKSAFISILKMMMDIINSVNIQSENNNKINTICKSLQSSQKKNEKILDILQNHANSTTSCLENMGNDIVYCKKAIRTSVSSESIKSIQSQINTITIEQSNINKKLEKQQNQINELLSNKPNDCACSITDVMQIQNDLDTNNKNILEIQNNINDMYVILKTNSKNIDNMKLELERVLFFLKDPNKPSSHDSYPITIPPDMLQSQKDQLSLLYTNIKQNMNKKYYKGKENEESEDEKDTSLKPGEKELILKWKKEQIKKDKQEEKQVKILQKKTMFEKRRSKIENNLNTLHLEADILRREEDDSNCNGKYESTQIKNAFKDRQQEIREKREVLKRININKNKLNDTTLTTSDSSFEDIVKKPTKNQLLKGLKKHFGQ